MRNSILFSAQKKDATIVVKSRRLLGRFFRLLNLHGCVVEVVLLSSRDLLLLKKHSMNPTKRKILSKKQKKIDVLAFPEPKTFVNPPSSLRILGDIYINQEIARRDSARFNTLLAHGFLHLLGHDHIRDDDAKEMERMERMLIGR